MTKRATRDPYLAGILARSAEPALVPCYPLAAVLTAEQMEAVRPFLRGTFTEMAEVFMAGRGTTAATNALCTASGACGWARIEAALYTKARALGIPPVLAPGRGGGR